MKKKLSIIFCIFSVYCLPLSDSLYTKQIRTIEKLLNIHKVENALQIGISDYTKILIKSCDSILSLGIRINKEQEDLFHKFTKKFNSYESFSSKNLNIPVKAVKAHNLALEGVNPNNNPYFSAALDKIKTNHVGIRMFDFALVSADNNIKGDIVNMLFNCVDIIVATDTNLDPIKYGWNRVKQPENYTRINFRVGTGLIFWVNKSQKDVIKVLKKMKRR